VKLCHTFDVTVESVAHNFVFGGASGTILGPKTG